MDALLAASDGSSSAPLIFFGCLAALALLVWGSQKYRESQAEKRSEELRQLYASVNSDRRRA